MSGKDCGSHGHKRRKIFRRIFAGILIFLFLVLITILIIWAILRPSKPKFVLQDVTVYAFNASVPNFLTSNFQVTFSSRNPNDKIGVYYDKLDVYATYRNQQITLRSSIPPTYQGHEEINVWSPNIYGTAIPVAPYNALALSQDQSMGAVLLMIKMNGRVRFKVGTFISGKYHLYVRCPAYIQFGSKTAGITVGENSIKYSLLVWNFVGREFPINQVLSFFHALLFKLPFQLSSLALVMYINKLRSWCPKGTKERECHAPPNHYTVHGFIYKL